MKTKSRAFTLVEILIAISIVAILIATLVFLLSPAVKKKSWEAIITGKLKSVSAAIALYRGDNDDKFPLSPRTIKPDSMWQVEGFPKNSSVLGPATTNPELNYRMGWRRQRFNEIAMVKIDPESDAIVKALMLTRKYSGKKKLYWLRPDGSHRDYYEPDERCLGVRADGSVSWFPWWEQADTEFAMRNHLLGK